MDRSIKCWRLPLTLFISLSSSGRESSSPPLEDEETHGEENDEEITKDNFRMLSWDLNQQEIDDEEEQEIEARIQRQQLMKKSHLQEQLQQGSNEKRKNLVVGEYIEEEEEVEGME